MTYKCSQAILALNITGRTLRPVQNTVIVTNKTRIGSGRSLLWPQSCYSTPLGFLEFARAAPCLMIGLRAGAARRRPTSSASIPGTPTRGRRPRSTWATFSAEQGDADGAKAAYQRAIDSGHAKWAPMAAYGLGVVLADRGDADGARAAYQRAIDSGHADWAPKSAVGLGNLLSDQGDADGAKAAYRRAIDSGHANWAPMAAFNLGVVLADRGDADGARAAYQRAIDSGHADWAPMGAVGLGVLLADRGDVDGARAAYQRAIDSGTPTGRRKPRSTWGCCWRIGGRGRREGGLIAAATAWMVFTWASVMNVARRSLT